MRAKGSSRNVTDAAGSASPLGSGGPSRNLLECAGSNLSRVEFLKEVSVTLMDFTGCDSVEIRLIEHNRLLCCEVKSGVERLFRSETLPCRFDEEGRAIFGLNEDSDLERFCGDVGRGRFDPSLPFFTTHGSFWIGDTEKPVELSSEACKWAGGRSLFIGGGHKSLAVIPFAVQGTPGGLLLLKCKGRDYFTADQMKQHEDTSRTLGVALAHQSAQLALRERVKELTCLYGLAKLAARPDISLERILQGTAELIPPSWLYPEIASARIVFDGRSFSTRGFCRGFGRLSADIMTANGEGLGQVEVTYSKEMPELDEGPFLKEERHLIDAIARELALIIERRNAEEEREKLQTQLRHADRLATIGQLAAGVAHELNEPLANILGFAQLAEKELGVPDQVRRDINSIVSTSLHAREVVRKLMLFARQTSPRKDRANLNEVVEDGLYFLESRCTSAGIELLRDLDPDLPEITADPGQLYQVLVNLVVNAIQAMPNGGHLTIRTARSEAHVFLIVEDTGTGMTGDVLKKIFLPFYTTKDVGVGTGLGLAVVDGIVSSHGGAIDIKSKVGRGSRFEVRLPMSEPKSAEGR